VRGFGRTVCFARVIFSLLHLVLTIRALLRCVSERYTFGILGGLARAGLMIVGAVIGFKQMAMVMLPGRLTLKLSPDAPSQALAVALLLVSIAGPVVTFAVLWISYRRYHDAPAAQEEKLQRPFGAWLPVGILDAISVAVAVFVVAFSE
jgi:hypothetical protein